MKERHALLVVAACLVACGSDDFLVALGPQPSTGRAVRVGYPPPPAKVEHVPLRRRDECRYQDGFYTSQGGAWVWKAGKWVVPDPNCYYAEPETKYEATPQGRLLMHRPGGYFQKKSPNKACKAPPVCEKLTEKTPDAPTPPKKK